MGHTTPERRRIRCRNVRTVRSVKHGAHELIRKIECGNNPKVLLLQSVKPVGVAAAALWLSSLTLCEHDVKSNAYFPQCELAQVVGLSEVTLRTHARQLMELAKVLT